MLVLTIFRGVVLELWDTSTGEKHSAGLPCVAILPDPNSEKAIEQAMTRWGVVPMDALRFDSEEECPVRHKFHQAGSHLIWCEAALSGEWEHMMMPCEINLGMERPVMVRPSDIRS